MDSTAVEGTSAEGAPDVGRLSTAHVFASDVGMTLALLNEARYLTLRRYFGVSREQANLLTAVVALAGADAAYVTVRHALHEPLGVTGFDVTTGGLVLREVVYGIAGPRAREVPFFGALVTAALVGRLAMPTVRRAIHGLRGAEHRIREQRLRVYNAAPGVGR
jgi:hypothetical protein